MNSYLLSLQNSIYFPKYSRLLLAIISAHYVIVARQPKVIFQIMMMPKYWLMLLISTAIAWAVLWYVEKVNRKLNLMVPWNSAHWPFRVLLQAVYGVYIPLRLVVMIMASVFLLMGKDFEASGYMQSEYFMVCWMMIVFNILLALLYFVKSYFRIKHIFINKVVKQAPTRKYVKYLDVTHGHEYYKKDIIEITCIVRTEETAWIYMSDGSFGRTDKKMKWFLKMFDPTVFCRINRWTLINLRMVKGYGTHPYDRVVLQEIYRDVLQDHDDFKMNQKKNTTKSDQAKTYEEDKLHISRNYFKKFQIDYDRYLNR